MMEVVFIANGEHKINLKPLKGFIFQWVAFMLCGPIVEPVAVFSHRRKGSMKSLLMAIFWTICN